MAITRVSPALIQVANNVTSTTIGNTTSIPSLTFDASGVIVAASNTTVSVANTNITGTISATQIAANSVNATILQTNSVENYMATSGRPLSNRNLIINGAMQVHQRGNQTSVSSNSYSLDRWEVATTGGTAVYDLKQSTDVPTGQGFANSFQLDVTTADVAMGSGDGYIFRQAFEGQNLQGIKKGTSNAEQVTVQFWVKSPKTGTHIIEMFDVDNTRQVSAAYSVASADTWEKFTVTFPADTTGAFDNDNARSLILQWWLAAGTNFTSGTLNTSWASSTNANRAVGQVNLLDDAANNFYITGVQFEVGSVATPFERRPFGTELQLCQRYYQLASRHQEWTYGSSASTASAGAAVAFIQTMRATPTITLAPAGNSTGQIAFLTSDGSYPGTIGTHTVASTTDYGFRITASGYTGTWSGAGLGTGLYASTNPTTVYTASAEL